MLSRYLWSIWLEEINNEKIHKIDNLMHSEELNLSWLKINNDWVKHLKRMPNLRKLDLSKTNINTKWLNEISQIDSIKELDLTWIKLNSKSVEYISWMQWLEKLDLTWVKLNKKQLEILEKSWINFIHENKKEKEELNDYEKEVIEQENLKKSNEVEDNQLNVIKEKFNPQNFKIDNNKLYYEVTLSNKKEHKLNLWTDFKIENNKLIYNWRQNINLIFSDLIINLKNLDKVEITKTGNWYNSKLSSSWTLRDFRVSWKSMSMVELEKWVNEN